MARPFKARRVCSQPTIDVFGPLNQESETRVELTLEEYETIRLIDLLDCSIQFCQEKAGGLSGEWKAAADPGRQLPSVSGVRELLRQGLREAPVSEAPL